jgi:hypothetical protein
MTHINERPCHLDHLGLKEAEFVKGFDPDNKFTTHMEVIDYSFFFTKIEQFQEGSGDNSDLPEIAADQFLDNMEELIYTNEGY